jgi:hypothetical protein
VGQGVDAETILIARGGRWERWFCFSGRRPLQKRRNSVEPSFGLKSVIRSTKFPLMLAAPSDEAVEPW